jgi:carboxyl-terminal processing protease
MNRFLSFNLRKGSLFLLLLIVASLSSCKKDATPGPESETDRNEINEWVVENMRYVYYWNQTIPADSRLNFSQEPPDFFRSLLNPADRFSWIAKADELEESLSGVSTSTGITITLVPFNCEGANCDLFATVRSVVPGSPAALAGVERGAIFIGVNGKRFNTRDYMAVLDPYLKGQGFSINMATLEGNTLTPSNETIALTATRIAEPSVHFKRMINTPSGRKVAYLFYNRFLNNRADELFEVFQEFKAAGANELVLDLRYNPGGGISVAGAMAALIKQDYAADQVFVNYNYNSILNEEFPLSERNQRFADLFPPLSAIDDEEDAVAEIDARVKAGNLNLSRVYILGTGSSASASELVIHNLAPYIEVIHIGEQTMGKNEGSLTIKDERKPPRIDWAIQPIVVKLADKNGEGDYDTGLNPDVEIDEFDFLPLMPHGSEEDPLIARALTLIDPAMASKTGIAKSMDAQRRQRSQGATFKAFEPFNQLNKHIPVQLDGTIDQDQLKRLSTP